MNDFFRSLSFILHRVILYLLYLYQYFNHIAQYFIHLCQVFLKLFIGKQEPPGEIPQNMACHQGLHGLLLQTRYSTAEVIWPQ